MIKKLKICWQRIGPILILFVFLIAQSDIFLNSLSLKAQEYIKILPGSYQMLLGDWQNVEAIFSQDLSPQAGFSQFNKENSAYLTREIQTAASSTSDQPGELVLKHFNISPPPGSRLSRAALKFSLAGQGGRQARLAVDYFIEETRHLALLDLSRPLDNAFNRDYFSYRLYTLDDWADLENLQIIFRWQADSSLDKEAVIYLEAVWLEAEYEAGLLSPMPEEELMKSESASSTGANAPAADALERPPIQEESRADSLFDYQPEDGLKIVSPERVFSLNQQPFFEVEYREKTSLTNKLLAGAAGFLNQIDGSNLKQASIEAEVAGLAVQPEIIEQTNGRFFIQLPRPDGLKPGRHRLKIRAIKKGGEAVEIEQDFFWGVLAINTNQSIYLPGEEAYLQMAVLREDGHTVCDASLRLEITQPNSQKIIFSTNNRTIKYSGQCGPNNITDAPDYFAFYRPDQSGLYQMKLTNLDNGFFIEDSFAVRLTRPFAIERKGPTRIYPPSSYQMSLKIRPNNDFQGEVVEKVPSDFAITVKNARQKITETGEKEIIWQVDWQAGQQYDLGYTLKAPPQSPYLYLLGPLALREGVSGKTIFQEAGQWQIAADSSGEVYIFWDGSADAPAGWNCFSCAGGDTYYEKFPRGADSPGGTGGNGTHRHPMYFSADGGAGANGGYDLEPDEILVPDISHTHSGALTATSMDASLALPPYYELKIIYANNPSSIPQGGIVIFDTADLPANFSPYTPADGYLIRTGPDASTTVATYHNHTNVAFTTGPAVGTILTESSGHSGESTTHTHSFSGGETGQADALPPYIDVVLAKATANVSLSNADGMIAMFDTTPLPDNWAAVDAINASNFIMATTDTYGSTGGSAVHNHPNQAFTVSATTDSIPNCDQAPGTEGADVGHTHQITISYGSASNLPPYVDLVFAKYTAPAGNSEPSIVASSVVFHYNSDIVLTEWSPGPAMQGTTTATTTFTVQDTDGWSQIATTTLILYRSGVSGEQNCASSTQNCYRLQSWSPSDPGSACQRIATTSNTASFMCTSSLQFFAQPTDIGSSYVVQWWEAYASSSDIFYAQTTSANATNTGIFLDIITTKGISIYPTSINYGQVSAGRNTADRWATTTATTTGNVAVDIHFEGSSMTGPGTAIASIQQRFTTSSGAGYDYSLGFSLPDTGGAGETHDLYMTVSDSNPPASDNANAIYWGIAIPVAQAIGSYTGQNTLTATSTIRDP